jgi:hypothetical protein
MCSHQVVLALVHEQSYYVHDCQNGPPMNRYKDHPIYGVAVPAPENRWYSRGLVFDRDLNQTIEIKRIEPKRRTFKTKKQAEQYGLDLCRAWVDKQPDPSHT